MISLTVEHALRVCIEAHNGQFRKGGQGVPYAVHPTHMALILARFGATEAVIVAALLHDTVEDCEDWTIERVAHEFGTEVARLVDDLTEDKSKTWAERKQAAVDHVAHMSDEAVMVKAADKLHNLTSLLDQLMHVQDPQEVWRQFKGGREETLRMAHALVGELIPRLPSALADELRAVLAGLDQLA